MDHGRVANEVAGRRVSPLSIYLLTYILAFSRWQLMSHVWMVRAFPVAILLLLFLRSDSVLQEMVKHLAVFFVGSMVFHGELARRRPGTSRLTAFCVWMAVGGVLGGMFNSLVGPLLFPSYWEYPLTLLLACLLFWGFRSEHDPKQLSWSVFLPEGLAVAVVLLLAVARGSLADGLVTVVPLVVLGFLAKRLTLVFTLGVGLVLLATEFGDLFQDQKAVLHSERTFFLRRPPRAPRRRNRVSRTAPRPHDARHAEHRAVTSSRTVGLLSSVRASRPGVW